MNDIFDRVIEAALPRIEQRGVLNVPISEICIASGLSEHEVASVFSSIDDIAIECLARREREWTFGLIEQGARASGTTPRDRLLAIFDVLTVWFHDRDFAGCTFTNVLIEMGASHPLGRASIRHLLGVRSMIATLAREADLRDPEEVGVSLHILMKGAIVAAMEGDADAARRAIPLAEQIIAWHRPISQRGDEGRWLGGSPRDDYDDWFVDPVGAGAAARFEFDL